MDNLKLSKSLAEIHTQVPLNASSLLNDMKFATDITKILNICNEHELFVSRKYLTTHFN
ncbi:5'-3' exonuclease [Staphylococcus gallinarum]|nr:5'-3' exonuclease [Staphylococcus gallinarum]